MKLSLCCISNTLHEQKIRFQTMTYTRFSKLDKKTAIKILSERTLNNFEVNLKTIKFCVDNKFSGYRMSSSLMPLIGHPKIDFGFFDLPDFQKIKDILDQTKSFIKSSGIRISAHPSEYISLTSDQERVITNSIKDLEMHALLFDLLDLPKNYSSPLNIHCRQDGDPIKVSGDFFRNFDRLNDSVKSRLVVEVNDNKNGTWTINNLYKHFYKNRNVPITYDSLHHSFCNDGNSHKDAFDLAYSTWNVEPLFHYSEGKNGTRSHADYATSLPVSFGKSVVWDVELKAKDFAIKRILAENEISG